MKKYFFIFVFCFFSSFLFCNEQYLQNKITWLVEGPVEVIQGWWEEDLEIITETQIDLETQSNQDTLLTEDLKGGIKKIKPNKNIATKLNQLLRKLRKK